MNRERGLRILKEMLGEDPAAQVQRAWQEIFTRLRSLRHRLSVGRSLGPARSRPAHQEPLHHRRPGGPGTGSGGLELNIRMARRNGATRREIVETLLHIAPYAGFPAAWEGIAAVHEILGSGGAEGSESSGS